MQYFVQKVEEFVAEPITAEVLKQDKGFVKATKKQAKAYETLCKRQRKEREAMISNQIKALEKLVKSKK